MDHDLLKTERGCFSYPNLLLANESFDIGKENVLRWNSCVKGIVKIIFLGLKNGAMQLHANIIDYAEIGLFI